MKQIEVWRRQQVARGREKGGKRDSRLYRHMLSGSLEDTRVEVGEGSVALVQAAQCRLMSVGDEAGARG